MKCNFIEHCFLLEYRGTLLVKKEVQMAKDLIITDEIVFPEANKNPKNPVSFQKMCEVESRSPAAAICSG